MRYQLHTASGQPRAPTTLPFSQCLFEHMPMRVLKEAVGKEAVGEEVRCLPRSSYI